MAEFPPRYLSIATPLTVGARPRGATASKKEADPQRTIRMPDDIIASIDKAAAILEINRAEFIRWVSYAASQEVIHLHALSKK